MNLRNELKTAKERIKTEGKEKQNLRKKFEELSEKLNFYIEKAEKEREKAVKKNNEEDINKEIELKKNEIRNLELNNTILKHDNKKLRNTIKKLQTAETMEIFKTIEEKNSEINELKTKNKEQEYEIKSLKYSKNKIKLLNEEVSKRERIILKYKKKEKDFLYSNRKLTEEKTNSNIKNKSLMINKKLNFPKLTNRSNSMVKIKQEEKKKEKKNEFFISGKNFYKLFDEKEREAIINGFSSQQDLNKFNEKIEIIGNRNKSIEKMMKNENNQLTKENRIKNTKIVDLEEKNKLFERNISGLQNQLKNQKIINEKLEKQINKFNDEKNNYIEIIKQKDEEINKIKAENNKLMSSMKENKKDIDQEQIRKNQEKEMKSFIDELGIIKVYDINKILNKDIKFTDSSLKKIIGEQFSYHGVTTSIKETEDKKEENQEKKVKKKKKKNRNDKGEEKGEKSDNIKLCKKEK